MRRPSLDNRPALFRWIRANIADYLTNDDDIATLAGDSVVALQLGNDKTKIARLLFDLENEFAFDVDDFEIPLGIITVDGLVSEIQRLSKRRIKQSLSTQSLSSES